MKRLLFLMAMAVAVSFGTKAQTITFTLTKNPANNCAFGIAELHAYCPDDGDTYVLQFSTSALSSGIHVLGGSGQWAELTSGTIQNPPCNDLVLLRVEYPDCNGVSQVAITNHATPTTTGNWGCCSGSMSVQVNSSYWPIVNTITVN